ncbi:MAG: GHMP kinase [Gammaproteobacteria bacterium]|nr:GHMP kinase [Gammaproteobacteria bacterium]
MNATAFAPGNVSGVFKIVRDDDPRRMHSLGMGFTVAHGVTATVRDAPVTEIAFNGKVFDFATVRSVAEALSSRPVRIELESELPLSGGFGLSGASALATAYALDTGFELGLDERALGMTAHVAEVTNLTGLGDVCGQFRGGCLAKLVPGDPLAAIALPVAEQTVYWRYFSPIMTREIIGDPGHAARINAAADSALADIGKLADRGVTVFGEYIASARRFAIESGLLSHPDVRRIIADVEAAGGAASMIMLGNAVFSTIAFEGARETRLARQRAGVVE